MKLIIDVENDYYEMLKYNVEHGQDYKPFEIIANGIPYEATQGDLISREALKKAIDNAPTVEAYTKDDMTREYLKGYNACKDMNERPQGYWVKDNAWRNGEYIGGFWHRNCPCVDGYSSKYEYNFCPNCGTKMHKGGAE